MPVPEIDLVGVTDATARPDFDSFFRSEYPNPVSLATAVTGDRQAGEDVAAEAMSRAYRRWDRIGAYDKPGAWTRRVAVNLLNSRRRRLTSELRAVLRLSGRGATEADRSADVTGAANFRDLLAPLPPRQRTAVALHYLHDLPVADIAEAMDCAEGTVKSHLHAARAVMAEAVERDEES